MQIPLIKGDAVDDNVDYRDALPVNMTAINHPIKGAQGYMYQWFGLSLFADGEGVDRGARWVSRSDFQGHYRVSGNSFIKVNSNGSTTVLGVVPGSEQIRIAFSFNNIAIVADGNLYYYNPDDGFRQIVDPEIGSPIDIVWADGVFILTDGEIIYHSDITNEEEYLVLDFATAEFRPDVTYGLGINEDNELIAFGENTTEYYTNQGKQNFQYARISLKALKLGILGTHCKTEKSATWFVVGRREESSPGIYIVQGGGSKRISSREVDKILDETSDGGLRSVTMDSIIVDAINYVIIHLPNQVLLYNQNIGDALGTNVAWTILRSDVSGTKIYRGKNFVRSSDTSKWIGGDKRGGNIGFLDPSVATHYGDIAEWLLFTPLVNMETRSVDVLELETIPGVAPDEDATLFLSQTVDGKVWSNEEVELYAENLDYDQRFYIRGLGYVRRFIAYRFRGASRSRMSFAFLNIEAS